MARALAALTVSSMRWRGVYPLLGVAVVAGASALVLTFLRARSPAFIAKKNLTAVSRSSASLEDRFRRHRARVLADHAAWEHHPLLAPHDGGNAASLLAPHLGWRSKGTATLPQLSAFSAREAVNDGGWAFGYSTLDPSGVDLAWMEQLASFGYWDVESAGGPLATAPYTSLDEDLPRFSDAVPFAEARLVAGLRSGDARPAATEVRELVRLLLSTERAIVNETVIHVLFLERAAFEVSRADGLPVDGWTPIDAPSAEALLRALNVSLATTQVWSGPSLSAAALPVGRCAALADGAGLAVTFHGYLRASFPDRYADLERQVAAAPCRLQRLRRAWADVPDGGLPGTLSAVERAATGSAILRDVIRLGRDPFAEYDLLRRKQEMP